MPVTKHDKERAAFAEKLFRSALGFFDVLSIHLGATLGLYRSLLDDGPATSSELAARAEIAERYAREWLEQQTSAGILVAEIHGDRPTRFSLPEGHAEVLLDGDSLFYGGASVRQLMTLPGVLDRVADAFRTGRGVPYAAYGAANVEGQGAGNRPVFLKTLPEEWLPAIPTLHERLSVSDPPARVVDVGCGTGWSSVAIAKAYPSVTVVGFDPDETSVEAASRNAASSGVSDRVRFHPAGGAEVAREGPFDIATAFECIHDMARPVEVLTAVHESLVEGGAMLVVDERAAESFRGLPDEFEAYLYGWSIFDCLPAGMSESPTEGTGTVMRPATLRRYAETAGFRRFEVLPIEHETFRLYLLRE